METHKLDTGWTRDTCEPRGNWRGCQLDTDQCLSLEQILQSFSAPISEEHAWAVIHQVSTLEMMSILILVSLKVFTLLSLLLSYQALISLSVVRII